MNTRLVVIGTVAAALLAGAALAKELGTTRVEVELMAAPYRDAKSAGALPGNTRVEVLERRGAWLRVTAGAGKSGWARLHQVRLGTGPEKKGDSGLTALWSVGQTGRSGTQGIVATTGIRGMSAEELKNARPDPQGVQRLEQYRASAEAARTNASGAGLREKSIDWLPRPE